MKIKRRDGILKIMITVFPLIVLGNAIEYFFISKNDLKRITGRVSEVILVTYDCSEGGRRVYTKRTCEKTTIRLENVKGSFSVSDYLNRGSYIDAVEKGDEVTVYIRKWYQYILTFGGSRDIYGLEKDGVSYYSMSRWKASNVAFIFIFGVLSLFFWGLYILQKVTMDQLIKRKKV